MTDKIRKQNTLRCIETRFAELRSVTTHPDRREPTPRHESQTLKNRRQVKIINTTRSNEQIVVTQRMSVNILYCKKSTANRSVIRLYLKITISCPCFLCLSDHFTNHSQNKFKKIWLYNSFQ